MDQLGLEGEKCSEETGTNRRIHFTKDNRDNMVDMRVVVVVMVVMVVVYGGGGGSGGGIWW